MNKGIIYYTDNRLEEPIYSIVQKFIAASNLPITSVSLKPISFGRNIVLSQEPSYLTMITQITTALENAKEDYVFFCEHDVLYPKGHFDFTPKRNDIFYYNDHVWRWKYPDDLAISYDRLMSLSGLCVNRELVLKQYKKRLKAIYENGWDKITSHEPFWARRWGYEPGTKKMKRGGFSDDDYETWKSEFPLIDIRHRKTFSPPKVSLSGFKHLPTNWKEITLDQLPGWNLKELFKL